MPIVSLILSYEQYAYGWSEKYYTEGVSTNLNDYYIRATNLLMKRMPLCGKQTMATYLRLSTEDEKGDSLLFAVPNGQIVGNQSVDSDAPTNCLLLNCADVTRKYKKKIYLRGVWDSVITLGGKYTPTPQYEALVNSFWAYLKTDNQQVPTAWGWLAAKRPGTVRNITALAQQPDGTVRITATGDNWPGPFDGRSVEVRLSRVASNPQLNGTLVVVPQSAQVAITLRRIPIFAAVDAGGRMRYSDKEIRYTDFANITRAGEHRTGRPTLQPRGRQRARIRG